MLPPCGGGFICRERRILQGNNWGGRGAGLYQMSAINFQKRPGIRIEPVQVVVAVAGPPVVTLSSL